MSVRDDLSVSVQAGREKASRLANRLSRNTPSRFFSSSGTADRLVLAPQDLRTPDATTARDIYSGRYFLAGNMIDCAGDDPFLQMSAPERWQAELHSFGWLRHLEAEGGALTKSNAQVLINDWLTNHSKPKNNVAWKSDVPAKRLIYWMCHSVPVVEASTPRFYQQWLKSIVTHIRFLKYKANEIEAGLPRLTVRIALAYASICVSGQKRVLRNAAKLLDQELILQIAPDGNHISRNPAVIIDILTLLLPLRQSFARLGLVPSQTLISSIDRMMAALKFFQMGDGNLARFNGVSVSRPDLVSTIRFYDDSMGNASENATYSGFQRMAMGDTILIADTGKPPKSGYSQLHHAGTLSFEFSSGSNLVMVNCGSPFDPDSRLANLARSSAAHNTAIINDTSSSRFYNGSRFSQLLKNRIISAPHQVTCQREDRAGLKKFTASHDGYRHSFGIIHSRAITMTHEGQRIEGEDNFSAPGGGKPNSNKELNFAIRFHLHPSVSAGKTEDGNSIIMMCGSGLFWRFTCMDCPPEIDESLFLTPLGGQKRSKQIVLSGDAKTTDNIRWLITRHQKSG